MLVKKLSAACVLGFSLISATSHAAAPSVAGTTWDLTGKYKGSAKVSCKIGGTHSAPINSKKVVLKAGVTFNNDGTFSWIDQAGTSIGGGTVAGTWTQDKAKVTLSFANWYNSPLSAFAYNLAQGLALAFNNGNITSIADIDPPKYSFTSTINSKGTSLKVAESVKLLIKASASAGVSSNSCNFTLNFGRTYTGI